MPIYEYQCEKCGEFEVTQRITEDALKKCPTCKRKVKKLISNTSFQLKGSGWYVTDYARKGKDGGKDSGTPAKSTDSTSASSDSGASSSDSTTSSSDTKTSGGSETKKKSSKKDSAAKAA
jgi:putative FmdB family regulatory protein